jgi:hypothetical protein
MAGRELVLNGRGIHVRGQAGNGREAIGADVTRTAEAMKIPVFHPQRTVPHGRGLGHRVRRGCEGRSADARP